MKIGIFDSGLGGLVLAKGVIDLMPEFDYMYLGDTARVPYGTRSQSAIYTFTEQAVHYLFEQDCKLVILACNTASAEALRKLQQEYLPAHYSDRKVLGVIVPTAEEATKDQSGVIGVLATPSTVKSEAFVREIIKLDPEARVIQKATPLLVPLIENDGLKWIDSILDEYLENFNDSDIDTLILGCTHYPIIKDLIRRKLGKKVRVISQDEVIPQKLANYLERHNEVRKLLGRKSGREFVVTDLTAGVSKLARNFFGNRARFTLINLETNERD